MKLDYMTHNDPGDETVERRLMLIRGLPGSGKTTLARRLLAIDPRAVHFEADMWFEDENGVYQWDVTKLRLAHEWCHQMVEKALAADTPLVIVSNTFTKQWEMDNYRYLAHIHGYQLVIVSIESGGLTPEALAARCVHNVPLATIERMAANWEP